MDTALLTAGVPARNRLELVGLVGLFGLAAALQLSIAAAGICLGITLLFWVLSAARGHDQVRVPRMFVPLLAYGCLTLLSSAFSTDPETSFIDDKQLVLFLIVPAVYSLSRGSRARLVLNVVITIGALSAMVGIFQYGVLEYAGLGRRPEGLLTHYMTYSGILVLVIAAAAARVFFSKDWMWPAITLPALLAALALTLTRGAWIGACVAIALLLAMRDFRAVTLLPVLVAVGIAIAPDEVTNRVYSIFDLNDPTTRDRVAMLEIGVEMTRDHPLTGVGPNLVQRRYPEYRTDPDQPINPHLHNVPMQIAAERGLPALVAWIWFIGVVVVDLIRFLRTSPDRFLPAAGLAATAGMLAAGLFEYNFGDSEFLMLFLILVTLPYAAARGAHTTADT